jgi:outer membrane protein OmpA-like peptidoglycan-associated protein
MKYFSRNVALDSRPAVIFSRGVGLSICAALTACAPQEVVRETPTATPATVAIAQPAPPAPPPVVALPYGDAVKQAARDLFTKAKLPDGQTFSLVIDPLVDGTTGMQSVATVALEQQVTEIVSSNYPRFQVKPFNAANLSAAPLVFIGTFTPINLQGKASGERDAYRVCFALADLKTGKIVSKGFARAQTGGIDSTPLPYFRDAPLWVNDKIVEGYIKTCQGTSAGDPINAAYLDKVSVAAGIDEATRAYNSKKYKESLALFTALLRNPAGDQPRVHTGIYLSNVKLGRRDAAMQVFSKMASQGIGAKRLAVKFGFQDGGSALAKDENPYDRWIKELAGVSSKLAKTSETCFEVGGHTGRGGSEPLNERLALQRAEYVKQRLLAERKDLANIITTKGYGSSEALVATGKGDPFDSLDRRIEFKSAQCPTKS